MKHSLIKEIISQGENAAVEFKSAEVKSESVAKEMIAFANTNGGVILLGVDDTGIISGISSDKKWEEWAMNIARNNINPPLDIHFDLNNIDGQLVGLITVPKGKNKPYQTNDGKYFIRIGSTNRIASISELMRLFIESGTYHFDLTGVEGTSVKSLNFNLISEYFKHFEIDFENESDESRVNLLTNTDILTLTGEVTVGGLLVFGLNPARYLFQSGITFVHYSSNDVTGELIDSKHIEGDLDYVISAAFSSIKNNLLTPSTIIGLKRIDSREIYSDKVFRELITNCCAHRNYSIAGSKIRILLFTDRIEFISPGKLPNTITIEKLSAGVSFRRNQLLTKFMVVFRLMDTFGRGLPNVIAEVKRLNNRILFEEIGEEFKVTLFL